MIRHANRLEYRWLRAVPAAQRAAPKEHRFALLGSAAYPVEVSYHGRPELIAMSVEDYELLRQGRKTPYRIDDIPIEKIERIAANRMDERHVHLNALMND